MVKRMMLFIILIVFSISTFGCSTETNDEASISKEDKPEKTCQLEKIWQSEPVKAWTNPVIADKDIFVNTNCFACLDSATGKFKWSTLLSGPTRSDYYIDDKMIIFSNGLKMNALNRVNGEIIWQFEARKEIFCTPAADKDILYITSCDGRLYAVDLLTGSLKWDFIPSDGMPNISLLSSPIINQDLIIYTGEKNLYAVDMNTRKEKWRIPSIYVTDPDLFSIGDTVYVINGKGDIYAIDARKGEIIWDKHLENKNQVIEPVIKDHNLYFIVEHDHLYGLDLETGEVVLDTNISQEDLKVKGIPQLEANSTGIFLVNDDDVVLIDTKEKKTKKLGIKKKLSSKLAVTEDEMVLISEGSVIKYKIK